VIILANAITGTPFLAASPTNYSGTNSQLASAIQTIWSKEILFQSMPILRFEQFAVKKTELGVTPGLTIKFMRYNNLGAASQLVEGVRVQPVALTASQFDITVAEHGFAVATSELLLNASFDDIMASASRLLGRNMALYLDGQARDTLLTATSVLYGYDRLSAPTAITSISPYDLGNPAANRAALTGGYDMTVDLVMDGVETLASKNVPRLGETYVAFIDPHQQRRLMDDPKWVEVTKYAAPGNFLLGEVGRIADTVFITTTQVNQGFTNGTDSSGGVYRQALMIGDNAFGHAISLPVELRDAGIQDYGREHGLMWYSIWGLGLITDQAVVRLETN